MIGITLGDPGGIGPEILLKAFQNEPEESSFLIVGSERVLRRHAETLHLPFPGWIRILDVDNVEAPFFGNRPEVSGRASVEYLERAFRALEEGEIHGLVTGPVSKESWHRCGYDYPGQTEFCAVRSGAKEYCMLMAGESFRIALLSTHLSLSDALSAVRRDRIVSMVRFLQSEFRRLGFSHPRIACAALNPHAGESGAFGREEEDEIRPALRELASEGIAVEGPIAPEVIFRKAVAERKWDVILALYHDQAMIPLKLLDFDSSANVTLGLPFIRTSPDHGTAFDIAGQGKASAGSMRYAMRLAAEWTARRSPA